MTLFCLIPNISSVCGIQATGEYNGQYLTKIKQKLKSSHVIEQINTHTCTTATPTPTPATVTIFDFKYSINLVLQPSFDAPSTEHGAPASF